MQFQISTLLVLVLSTLTVASPLFDRTTSSTSSTCDLKMGKKQVACTTACGDDATCVDSCAATAVDDYVGCAPAKRDLQSCQDAAENAAVACIAKCPTTGKTATSCSNKCTMGAEKAIINCA